MILKDRPEAGIQLAAELLRFKERDPVVLALPPGGVPVAETVELLRREVDEVVCLGTPSPFGAIGRFYVDFHQVDDDELRDLLERAAQRRGDRPGCAPT